MSFALTLTADVVEAEAGATTPVGLTVVNRGAEGDRFEVEVEGIDPEWRFIPVPTFGIEPGESRSEKIFLKPPRLPESGAGAYPFVVRVRSLESGETRTAQGLLKLQAFHHVTMEIAPKKGVYSPTAKRNDFRLTVVNLGNSEQTLQLSAQDPDERCAYEFENDQIVLGPGQQREVEMIADPKQTPLLSSARLIGFSVFARSLNERNVTATAQAQLEQRSLLSPGLLAGLVLFLAVVGGWWAMRPVPPKVLLSVNPTHGHPGDTIQVGFVAEHADHIIVKMGDASIYDGPPTNERIPVTLAGDGLATFVASATRDGRNESEDTKRVTIDPIVHALEPKILGFKSSEERVKIGSTFVLSWKVKDAIKLEVAPTPMGEFTPERDSLEVTAPSQPGEQVYTLIATNVENVTKKASVKVRFYQESEAKIIAFSANSEKVREEDGGRVTLSWQTSPGTVRTELKVGAGPLVKVDDNSQGYDTVIGAKTTFTLVATDANGLSTTRKVTVDYEKKEIVIDPTPPSGTTTGSPPPDPNFPSKIPPPTGP